MWRLDLCLWIGQVAKSPVQVDKTWRAMVDAARIDLVRPGLRASALAQTHKTKTRIGGGADLPLASARERAGPMCGKAYGPMGGWVVWSCAPPPGGPESPANAPAVVAHGASLSQWRGHGRPTSTQKLAQARCLHSRGMEGRDHPSWASSRKDLLAWCTQALRPWHADGPSRRCGPPVTTLVSWCVGEEDQPLIQVSAIQQSDACSPR